jgi:hypothetical protein
MSPAWTQRCPEGHSAIESRGDGFLCESCDVIYQCDPFDARESEFPVDHDVPTRDTADSADVLKALVARIERDGTAHWASVHQLPPSLGTHKQIAGALRYLKEQGFVTIAGHSSDRHRWQPSERGRKAAGGDQPRDPETGEYQAVMG